MGKIVISCNLFSWLWALMSLFEMAQCCRDWIFLEFTDILNVKSWPKQKNSVFIAFKKVVFVGEKQAPWKKAIKSSFVLSLRRIIFTNFYIGWWSGTFHNPSRIFRTPCKICGKSLKKYKEYVCSVRRCNYHCRVGIWSHILGSQVSLVIHH